MKEIMATEYDAIIIEQRRPEYGAVCKNPMISMGRPYGNSENRDFKSVMKGKTPREGKAASIWWQDNFKTDGLETLVVVVRDADFSRRKLKE